MIDSHCHLDDRKYEGDVRRIVDEAVQAGVSTIITIGTDLRSSEKAVEFSHQFESVYATVGVHPHDAKTFNAQTIDRLRELSHDKRVLAIGEIGLDYYRDLSPRPMQKQVFVQQLALAVELKRPVVIHTRESFDDTLAIVAEFADDLPGGVFHCFPGTAEDAGRVFELGFHISVGGVITYDKSRMAAMVAEVPLERVLLETDSPYLTPTPHRGTINRPALIALVRDKLAQIRGITPAEIERITDRNSRKLFGLAELFGG
jgi:TatD DNase family protein